MEVVACEVGQAAAAGRTVILDGFIPLLASASTYSNLHALLDTAVADVGNVICTYSMGLVRPCLQPILMFIGLTSSLLELRDTIHLKTVHAWLSLRPTLN